MPFYITGFPGTGKTTLASYLIYTDMPAHLYLYHTDDLMVGSRTFKEQAAELAEILKARRHALMEGILLPLGFDHILAEEGSLKGVVKPYDFLIVLSAPVGPALTRSRNVQRLMELYGEAIPRVADAFIDQGARVLHE